jgi:hypothetical protein
LVPPLVGRTDGCVTDCLLDRSKSDRIDLNHDLSPNGVFVWIDIARFDREDRPGFIARIEQEIQSRWIPMPSEHRHDAIEHIRNYDFPEQESWMIDIWESNSQNQRSSGNPIEYRDAFYIALRLAAG